VTTGWKETRITERGEELFSAKKHIIAVVSQDVTVG
jgi:hypothetical protein